MSAGQIYLSSEELLVTLKRLFKVSLDEKVLVSHLPEVWVDVNESVLCAIISFLCVP